MVWASDIHSSTTSLDLSDPDSFTHQQLSMSCTISFSKPPNAVLQGMYALFNELRIPLTDGEGDELSEEKTVQEGI